VNVELHVQRPEGNPQRRRLSLFRPQVLLLRVSVSSMCQTTSLVKMRIDQRAYCCNQASAPPPLAAIGHQRGLNFISAIVATSVRPSLNSNKGDHDG